MPLLVAGKEAVVSDSLWGVCGYHAVNVVHQGTAVIAVLLRIMIIAGPSQEWWCRRRFNRLLVDNWKLIHLPRR